MPSPPSSLSLPAPPKMGSLPSPPIDVSLPATAPEDVLPSGFRTVLPAPPASWSLPQPAIRVIAVAARGCRFSTSGGEGSCHEAGRLFVGIPDRESGIPCTFGRPKPRSPTFSGVGDAVVVSRRRRWPRPCRRPADAAVPCRHGSPTRCRCRRRPSLGRCRHPANSISSPAPPISVSSPSVPFSGCFRLSVQPVVDAVAVDTVVGGIAGADGGAGQADRTRGCRSWRRA